MNLRPLCLAPLLLVLACEDKSSTPAPSASAVASTPAPPATASAAPAASATASASAAPSASASAAPASADAMVMVKDPTAEPEKTVHAKPGGKVTLYLPDFPGTSWSYESGDKTLGKPKEEVVPGFLGPTTPAHQFTWTTTSPLFKAGGKHNASFVNKKAGKPNGTFKLTVVME